MITKKRLHSCTFVSPKIPAKLRTRFKQLMDRLVSSGIRRGPELYARLVEIARPENSIFHDLYDWNDRSAAAQYRLEQARQYVMSISVVYTVSKEIGNVKVRAISSVLLPNAKSWEYFTMAESISRVDVRESVRLQIIADIKAFVAKYYSYRKTFGAHLQTILNEMNEFVKI